MFGSPWLAILVLVAAVVASYANSLRCPFVFDDHGDIVDNPSIRRLWPLWNVFLVPSESAHGAANPARGESLLRPRLCRRRPEHAALSPDEPGDPRLAGLALFGIVRRTLLLPRLRDRFGRASTPLALAVALLWALHPLQTESVTYVIQRYESMMGLFYLLAIYGVVRCGDSTHPYGWGAVTVAAALLRWARRKWPSRCRS